MEALERLYDPPHIQTDKLMVITLKFSIINVSYKFSLLLLLVFVWIYSECMHFTGQHTVTRMLVIMATLTDQKRKKTQNVTIRTHTLILTGIHMAVAMQIWGVIIIILFYL